MRMPSLPSSILGIQFLAQRGEPNHGSTQQKLAPPPPTHYVENKTRYCCCRTRTTGARHCHLVLL